MKRTLLQVFLVGFAALVVAGGCLLPFLYPTQTLWYKTGWEKAALQAGHLFGVLAFLALVLQLLVGSRGALLERAFSVSLVMRLHRANGQILPLLVLCHIALVLLPEGLANLPLGLSFWPEMVGGAAFLAIVFQVVAAQWRQRLSLDYRRWRSGHRWLGYAVLLLAAVHVLFVADSFASGLPRLALLLLVGMVALRLVYRLVSSRR